MLGDGRADSLDLLPRAVRYLLLKKYPGLSGTDLCLMIAALALRKAVMRAEILTLDADLKRHRRG